MSASTSARHGGALAAYEHIAPFYDRFTAHHDYELWTQRLLAKARAYGLRGRRLLDVACGTGKSFLPLLSRGWEVTGCDLSPAMLERAQAKARGRVRLEVADMRSLPILGSFDLVWCLDDALNYLLKLDDLERCLGGLRRNLAPGGLVLFDLNTLRAYRTFFSERHTQDHGATRMIWSGQASAQTAPGSEVAATFEVVAANGHHEASRYRSIHRQRHFPPQEVACALEAAGLRTCAVFGQGLDGHLQQPLDEARHTKAVLIARATPCH